MASVTILCGDARATLSTLLDESVQTCITSPPYFGLRDYGIVGQLGLERTPDEYVCHLVQVFCEVRRVLREDGTVWLNIGDSYAANRGSGALGIGTKQATNAGANLGKLVCPAGLKPKDLIGIPWRVALALQAAGWYLRSDIIWHKTNPMTESVKDRPTRSHEYIFLLTKSARYYYDADAIQEPFATQAHENYPARAKITGRGDQGGAAARGDDRGKSGGFPTDKIGRNKRSVWTIPTRAYKGAHFATFPSALIEPCILAGSREGDIVLDPFGGAGTTGLVAAQHNRDAVLIELNPTYCDLAAKRLADADIKSVGVPGLVWRKTKATWPNN